MRVADIEVDTAEFQEVLALWRPHSDTLGWLPLGAFKAAARRGELVGVFDGDKGLLGYVLFRTSESFGAPTASISHLCVKPQARGTGIARRLFDAVRRRTSDCAEIRVRCRRDFDANQLWPKLGFVARGERAARADGCVLNVWTFAQGLPPILGLLARAASEQTGIARCVLDASVFFDLGADASVDGERPEAFGLLADWLTEYAQLCVVDELLNQINRHEEPAERERQRARMASFPCLTVSRAQLEQMLPRVRAVLAEGGDTVGADASLLASAVAGDADVLVTRDAALLRAADRLELAFGLLILAPHELVVRSDTLRRSAEYQPRRLAAGTSTRLSRAAADDVDSFVALQHHGEIVDDLRRVTRAKLRAQLAQPDAFEARIVLDAGEPLAAFVLARPASTSLVVTFFAVAPSKLGRTAARHFAEHIVSVAALEKRPVVCVQSPGPRTLDALRDVGFAPEGDTWIKIVLASTSSAGELAEKVAEIGRQEPLAKSLGPLLASSLRQVDEAVLSARSSGAVSRRVHELERVLWPAKIAGARIPCFLVPIQPDWAKDLFDTELALGTLFGGRSDLVLNGENAYYRAAAPPYVVAPARVLWFVSKEKGKQRYGGTMAIRACSRIDEVITRPAKELYGQLRRLGAFEWKHVLAVAKGNAEAPVMGIRFSGTELFSSPVPRSVMEEVVFRNEAKHTPLFTAQEIDEGSFFELYRRGTDRGA